MAKETSSEINTPAVRDKLILWVFGCFVYSLLSVRFTLSKDRFICLASRNSGKEKSALGMLTLSLTTA